MKIYNSIPAMIISFGASIVLAAELPPNTISQHQSGSENSVPRQAQRQLIDDYYYGELMAKPSGVNQKTGLRGASQSSNTNSWQSKAIANMDNQMLWESKDISNYSYQMNYIGSDDPSMVVTVLNKNQATGVDVNGVTISDAPTMDDLFVRIQNALQRGVLFAEMTYDPEYGYPDYIDIIYNDKTFYHVEITNFLVQTNNEDISTTALRAQSQPGSKSQAKLSNWQLKAITNMDNQMSWKSKDISNYSYQMNYIGSDDPSMVVTVLNKDQATGVDVNGVAISDAPTMDDLFVRIQNALQRGVLFAEMTYDPEYGYPDYIEIIYNDKTFYHVEVTKFISQ